MRVLFPAALDGITCDAEACLCHAWLALAAGTTKSKSTRRKGARDQHAFPFCQVENALLDTMMAAAGRVSEAKEPVALESPFSHHPVFGWATPDGVELGFSSLCPQVRKSLAETDEPVALASGEGGWRQPIQVFQFSDGLSEVRISPRIRTPWHRYFELREVLLDLVVDRRHPLLARLAQAGALTAFVLSERYLPEHDLVLTARSFLSYRGQLEARVASAPVEDMATFAAAMLPLYGDDIGLEVDRMGELAEAMTGDWRAQLKRWLVPAEASLSCAFEAYLGLRLFMTPLDRDQSLNRGYAELFESFAIGLRFIAAISDVLARPVDPTMLLAAMMLGEHQVRYAKAPIPAYTPPPESHVRGPRMADLDMTFESIC